MLLKKEDYFLLINFSFLFNSDLFYTLGVSALIFLEALSQIDL